MYYFGTNLDSRFSVDGFWPSKAESNQIPTDPDDIRAELERLRRRRLERRARRLAEEARNQDTLVEEAS